MQNDVVPLVKSNQNLGQPGFNDCAPPKINTVGQLLRGYDPMKKGVSSLDSIPSVNRYLHGGTGNVHQKNSIQSRVLKGSEISNREFLEQQNDSPKDELMKHLSKGFDNLKIEKNRSIHSEEAQVSNSESPMSSPRGSCGSDHKKKRMFDNNSALKE